jgi:hypothetical protein
LNDPKTGTGAPEDAGRRTTVEAQIREKKGEEKSGWFALANLLSVIASIGTVVLSIFASDLAARLTEGTGIDFDLPRVHWMAAVVVLDAIYVVASYLISAYTEKGGLLALLFRIPSWVELRNFGEQRIAKISYIALIAIPLGSYFVIENPLQIGLFERATLPLNTKISFFIAFFFSLALITFAVGCPKEFHRKPMFESAKTVNLVLTSVERTVVNVEDRQDFYDPGLDASRLELRAACWLFYTLGLVLSVVILIRSALFVLNA